MDEERRDFISSVVPKYRIRGVLLLIKRRFNEQIEHERLNGGSWENGVSSCEN